MLPAAAAVQPETGATLADEELLKQKSIKIVGMAQEEEEEFEEDEDGFPSGASGTAGIPLGHR